MKHVRFVCNHDAGRAQMAQAFFERCAPEDVHAESAGTSPNREIWPEVVQVMREIGIDLSAARPRKLPREMQPQADGAVTMGCGETCPVVRGPRHLDWHIDDPAGCELPEVGRIRHQVADHVLDLLNELLP